VPRRINLGDVLILESLKTVYTSPINKGKKKKPAHAGFCLILIEMYIFSSIRWHCVLLTGLGRNNEVQKFKRQASRGILMHITNSKNGD
jgi:hypothetical protein